MLEERQKMCPAAALPGARKAQTAMVACRPDLETLAAVIARSPIVVTAPKRRLPAGYDETEIAILDWIVDEGRRAVRLSLPM